MVKHFDAVGWWHMFARAFKAMGKTAGQKVRDRYRVYVANGKTPRALTAVNKAILEEVRMEVATHCGPLKTKASSTTNEIQHTGDEGVCCIQHTGLWVNWATWLDLDMHDDDSDEDPDYQETEEEEDADYFSDNDVTDSEVEQMQTMYELIAEIAQAHQDRKQLQDKIGYLQEELALLSKAASLETSRREQLEMSATEALERAAATKRSLDAVSVELADAQRQVAWHQSETDWIHTWYVHGGQPPPDVMRRIRKLCSL